jgi:octanoyl-[GcvH]:protein N-octanoyltransferase
VTALYVDRITDAALDVAVSHALLRDATERGVEALRVWTPPAALSFGRLDLLSPRSSAAIAAAREQGMAPVRRLAGGRAAAIGPGTVCFGWAYPTSQMTGMQDRYRTMAEILVRALARVGAPARVGELPGEWCPGTWSVIAGAGKVGGLAQRVVRGGAWAEAVIVVTGASALARSLDHVQRALGVAWDPDTLSGLPGATPERVRAALIDELESRWPLIRAPLPAAILGRAAGLRAEHLL